MTLRQSSAHRPALGWHLVGLVLGWLLTGCLDTPVPTREPLPPHASSATSPDPGSDGPALARHFQCARCHAGASLEPVPLKQDCVTCHHQIVRRVFPARAELLDQWGARIGGLTVAPSLNALGQRFTADWIEGYLLQPHDLRPALQADMPRLPISPDQARALARWLAPEPARAESLADADVARGARLVETRGCGLCHQMSGRPPLPANAPPGWIQKQSPSAEAIQLAPDLRHVRSRFHPGGLVDFLEAPRRVKPDTLMPDFQLTRGEARDIARFLLETPLEPEVVAPLPARLPVLARRVDYDEVSEAVFRRTCWHCHSDEVLAGDDTGPGGTGGFGYRGTRLNLSSLWGLNGGAVGQDGRRVNIFERLPDGTPRLVAHLLARQQEVRGTSVAGILGMPLGFPPLSPEEIQLVESWIAQGRPE